MSRWRHTGAFKRCQKGTNKNDRLSKMAKRTRKEMGFWKFFMRSIAPSTWMRSVAIRRVATSSSSSNCGRPPRNRGMLTPVRSGIIPLMSNPQSAITVSSSSRSWSNPLRFVISLSHIRPLQSGDRNVITPFGEIPTSSLNVFVFL